MRKVALALLIALLLPGALILSGAVDTPIWAPVNKAGCYWHGLLPHAKLSVGESLVHGVPLPASYGGESRIASVEVLGSASQADVSFAVVRGAFGAYKGDIPKRAVALHKGRLRPAPEFNTGDRQRDETLETTASGVSLVVKFSANEPGHYEITGFRMVFRQGWRKATCTRDWGAKFDVV